VPIIPRFFVKFNRVFDVFHKISAQMNKTAVLAGLREAFFPFLGDVEKVRLFNFVPDGD
jgi:hypothetical protein